MKRNNCFKDKMIKNMKKLLRYICAILTAFLIIFWARKLLLANFHKLIEITPEEVITIFQDAGYKIDMSDNVSRSFPRFLPFSVTDSPFFCVHFFGGSPMHMVQL
jgi:hypothetical protein